MIAAILLIPTEGDPHGLLREGPCGARPPVVQRVEHRHQSTEDVRGCIECDGAWPCAFAGELAGAPYWSHHGSGWPTRALVLAWDGEPVAEGCLRVGWRDSIFTFWRSVSESIEGGATALAWLRQRCIDHDLGTLVLLDAEGREIKDSHSPAKGPQQRDDT